MLNESIAFRKYSKELNGIFVFMKSSYVVNDMSHPSVNLRCDAVTYFPTTIIADTDYDDGIPMLGKNIEGKNIKTFEVILDMSPHFYIVYFELVRPLHGELVPHSEFEGVGKTFSMRRGRTLLQLLRHIREWAYAAEHFGEENLWAQYAKKFFEITNPPQNVLDEIDSIPNQHLAKFINGEDGYFDQPESFPDMSEDMKDWFRSLVESNQHVSAEDKIRQLGIEI